MVSSRRSVTATLAAWAEAHATQAEACNSNFRPPTLRPPPPCSFSLLLPPPPGTLRPILRLALPVLAGQLLDMMMGFSDKWLTGHFLPGDKYLAAVTLVSYLLGFLPSVFAAVSISATAMVARFIGAGDLEMARRVANQALVIGAALAFVVTTIAALFGSRLVAIMGLHGDAADLTLEYLAIVPAGHPGDDDRASRRGGASRRGRHGDRAGGDDVSECREHRRGRGAGARLGSVARDRLARTGLWRSGGIRQHGRDHLFAARRRPLWAAIRMAAAAARFWSDPAAAADRDSRRDGRDVDFCLSILVSLDRQPTGKTARPPLTAWRSRSNRSPICRASRSKSRRRRSSGNISARGDERRAVHSVMTASRAALGIMSLSAIGFYLGADWLAIQFVGRDQPEIAAHAAMLVRIVAFGQPPLAILMVVNGALRGAGDTRWTLITTCIGFLLVRIPLAYWLAWDQIHIAILWHRIDNSTVGASASAARGMR